MAQRRQVQETGFLANLLQSGATGVSETLKERRESGQRIQELLLAGQLRREEEEAKPETQILREALGLSRQIQPLPELLVSPAASPEKQNRLQQLFQERTAQRTTEQEGIKSQIDSLLTMLGRKPQKSFEQSMAEEFGKAKARQQGQLSGIGLEGILPTDEQPSDGQPQRQSSIDRVLERLPQGASLRAGPLTLTKPPPTEEERSRRFIAESGIAFIDAARQRLQVKGSSVGRPDLLAFSRGILPETWQEVVQSSESRQLYTDLDSAFGNLALLLTGRQGDVQRLRQLQQIYYFGGLARNKPDAIINRFQAIDKLFKMFQTNAPLSQIHHQMDQMVQDVQREGENLTAQQAKVKGAVGRDEETGEYVDAQGNVIR